MESYLTNTSNETLECTFENIFGEMSCDDKCALLADPCGDELEFINFFKLFLCTLDGNIYVLMLIFLVLIFLIFRFICDLVDEYIAEAIMYISGWLGLSEVVAGVTLLALANGAGDLVTAVVSSASPEGVAYNIGSLFGAGLFVYTPPFNISTNPS